MGFKMGGRYAKGQSRLRKTSSRIKNGAPGFQNESALVTTILQYFKIKGVLAWRMPVQGVMQGSGENMRFKRSPIRGFPDIAGVYRGYFFALECKTEKGQLSEPQKDWIVKLHDAGEAFVDVVRPSNWKEICDDILEKIADHVSINLCLKCKTRWCPEEGCDGNI